MVNAALYLRRPLLVTGSPGTGKSTLAYAIAHELGSARCCTGRSPAAPTLQDGALPLRRHRPAAGGQPARGHRRPPGDAPATRHRHATCGSARSAPRCCPPRGPRVLLIDEIDKSDIDLPNDLLNVFEEGEFEHPRAGAAARPTQPRSRCCSPTTATGCTVRGGRVRCRAFPFVVITSNGERDFPPAFLRRCVRLRHRAARPRPARQHHRGPARPGALAESYPLIERFVELRASAELATDQLLNAIYLATSSTALPEATHDRVSEALFTDLASPG